jgi:hypothetical protein
MTGFSGLRNVSYELNQNVEKHTEIAVYTVNGLDFNFSIKHNSLKVKHLLSIEMLSFKPFTV